MLSLNRDLWVANPATGENGRLNATYHAGPANLIQAVTENFGIPINHYIEIDFVSFGGLVDAFGGIDIYFEHPAFDLASGLDVKQAGLVHLDGDQSLAFVRSRHYAEVIDGEVVLDLTSDLGRVQRQQVFLRAIMKKAGAKPQPVHADEGGREHVRRPPHRRHHDHVGGGPLRLGHGPARPGVGRAARSPAAPPAAAPRCSTSTSPRPTSVLDQFR